MKIKAYKITLREIYEDDLEMLRNWRNMPEIRFNMIDQHEISIEQQKRWFINLTAPNQGHYVVEYKNQAIGYANYKLNENRIWGETSLYIGEQKYCGTILAFCLALALLDYVFLQLKVQHMKADVLTHNTAAIRFNEQLGYVYIDKSDDLIKMKLSIKDYLNAKNKLTKIIRV
ncbi:MAG: GNAT family N-acetyltransferase [gamma proteobacterium symbiont of Taylorina sp.]|nr:GNAT family N-acetyltransferase [gamma proteobacterium symbiont of Taylorina sp.]